MLEDIQKLADTLETVAKLPVGHMSEQHRLAGIAVGTVYSHVGCSQHSQDIVAGVVERSRVFVHLVEARIQVEEDI